MAGSLPELQMLYPSPETFAHAVGGRSVAVELGVLRRALRQHQRLQALALAAEHLGKGEVARAAERVLALPSEVACEWNTSPVVASWLEAMILALDPSTSADILITVGKSLQFGDTPVATGLAAMATSVLQAYQEENSRRSSSGPWSFVETESLVARIDLPGLGRYARLSTSELASTRSVYHEAQSIIAEHLLWLHHDRDVLVPRIVPCQMRDGRLVSATNSDLLGAIFVTHHEEPALVAEQIVHETSHTRLFLIQMLDDLIEESYANSSWTEARHYSPWRRDPRPINGIFHGAFVFDAVAELWAGILGISTTSASLHSLGRRRLGQVIGQLQRAREVLEREAAFTAYGKAILKRLADRLDQQFLPLWDDMRLGDEPVLDLDGVDGVTAHMTVSEYLNAHAKQWQETHGGAVVR